MFIEVTLYHSRQQIVLNASYIEQFRVSDEDLFATDIWMINDPNEEPYTVKEDYFEICRKLGLK